MRQVQFTFPNGATYAVDFSADRVGNRQLYGAVSALLGVDAAAFRLYTAGGVEVGAHDAGGAATSLYRVRLTTDAPLAQMHHLQYTPVPYNVILTYGDGSQARLPEEWVVLRNPVTDRRVHEALAARAAAAARGARFLIKTTCGRIVDGADDAIPIGRQGPFVVEVMVSPPATASSGGHRRRLQRRSPNTPRRRHRG
jgi:hypothetical protein